MNSDLRAFLGVILALIESEQKNYVGKDWATACSDPHKRNELNNAYQFGAYDALRGLKDKLEKGAKSARGAGK